MTEDTLKQDIVRRLDRLSPEALREVRDFVGFLQSKRRERRGTVGTDEEKNTASDPLCQIAGKLDVAPLADRIDEELYGA